MARHLALALLVGCTGSGTTPAPAPTGTSTTASTATTGSTATTATTGDTGSSPTGPTPPCVDTSGFTWSTPVELLPAELSQAKAGAVALDDRGHAWFHAHEGFGSFNAVSVTHRDASGTWSSATPLASNTLSRGSWNPRVVVNAAGDGLLTYHNHGTSSSSLHTLGVRADGTTTVTPRSIGSDAIGDSVEPTVTDDGTVLALTTAERDGVWEVVGTDGTKPIAPVFTHPSGAGLNSWSQAPDGHGMLFVALGDSSLGAVPYSPDTGFGELEVITPTWSNGGGGVWLGDGRALAVYGVFPGAPDRVRVYARERLKDGTWAPEVRIDTGDGSSNPTAFDPVRAGAPGEAFVRFKQQDQEIIGRWVSGTGFVDIQTFSSSAVLDLAADRCGNAVVVNRVTGNNDLEGRHFRAKVGWQKPVVIMPDSGAGPQWAQVTHNALGQGLIVFELTSGYHVSDFR